MKDIKLPTISQPVIDTLEFAIEIFILSISVMV